MMGLVSETYKSMLRGKGIIEEDAQERWSVDYRSQAAMISFFPTIYPDEWWYSVICRFYVRTGTRNHSLVKEMLFGSEYAAMGSIYPNGTIARVLRQLPDNLYDFHDILHNHTTFRYFTRFYPEDDQRYMRSMFFDCKNLTDLDLSSFDTSIVTDMASMFCDCAGIETIYVRTTFDTSCVTEGASTFAGCFNLIGQNGTKYEFSNNDYRYAHIDTVDNSG